MSKDKLTAPTAPDGAMRVQLQQQSGGGTIHHRSMALRVVGGVTVTELVAALEALRESDMIPSREQGRADAALAKAIRWVRGRPPSGVSGRFSKSFYFDRRNPRTSWRFDIEGVAGYNLRQ